MSVGGQPPASARSPCGRSGSGAHAPGAARTQIDQALASLSSAGINCRPDPPTQPSFMLIRVATPSDAIPLAELKRDTFRETFLQDGFNIDYPPHDLAAYETQAYSVETVAGQLNDPQCRTWVAESDDGRLVGYAHAGPCKLPHPEVADGSGRSIRSTFGAGRKGPAPGARCSIPHWTIWPRSAPARCGSACGPATRRPSPSTRKPVSGRSARTISR